jgi:segregation and condensation protein A
MSESANAVLAGLKPEPYTIHLDNFDGPLDLLLHLIRREEMNIYDIPIARITEQYLQVIADLSAVDIDRASEFLVMAATLLTIKARMLLPKPPKRQPEEEQFPDGAPEEELDPRAELIRQLVTYSQYKEIAAELREKEQQMFRHFTRQVFLEEPAGPPPLRGLTLTDLMKAFEAVLQEEWNWREVPKEEIPLREKLREIQFLIGRSPGGIRFHQLFTRGGSRLEVIVTFLAILQLIHQRKIMAMQAEPFGEIWLRKALPLESAPQPDDDDEEAADE